MNLLIKTATLAIACLFSYFTYAQPGRGAIKQPPRINGVLKATTNAAVKAKIHANSNSVFGTGTNNAKYNKKEQPKKEAVKKEEEVVTTKSKKQKNNKL